MFGGIISAIGSGVGKALQKNKGSQKVARPKVYQLPEHTVRAAKPVDDFDSQIARMNAVGARPAFYETPEGQKALLIGGAVLLLFFISRKNR